MDESSQLLAPNISQGMTEYVTPQSADGNKNYYLFDTRVESAICMILLLIILFGNSLILILLQRIKSESPYRIFAFMFWLSIFDIGVGGFSSLTEFLYYLEQGYSPIPSAFACQVWKFLQHSFILCSIYIKVALAIDRYVYLSVAHPTLHCTRRLTPRIMIMMALIIGTLLSIPNGASWTYGYETDKSNLTGIHLDWAKSKEGRCFLRLEEEGRRNLAFFNISILFFIPFLIFVFTWGHICLVLFTQKLKQQMIGNRTQHLSINRARNWTAADYVFHCCKTTNNPNPPSSMSLPNIDEQNIRIKFGTPISTNIDEECPMMIQSNSSKEGMDLSDMYRHTLMRARKKATAMTLVTLGTYIICWAPYTIVLSIVSFYPTIYYDDISSLGSNFLRIGALTYMLNSLFNPWIYLMFSQTLRAEMKKLFCAPMGRGKRRYR